MVARAGQTILHELLAKIGARIIRYGRSITFQMIENMVPRGLFQQIPAATPHYDHHRRHHTDRLRSSRHMGLRARGEVRPIGFVPT